VAAGDSYLSRFFVKFVEISAAGVATAVSGFVLAHFTGFLNSPQPAALQSPAALQAPAPAPVTVPVAPVAMPASVPSGVSSLPAAWPSPAAPAQRAAATPPQQDTKSNALRKSLPADKPADTANAAAPDGKVRDVTDTKPRSADAIEAEVRAALAKVDAGHPAKVDNKADNKTDNKPDAAAEAKAETKPEIKPETAAPRRPVTQPDVASRTPAPELKPEPKPRPAEASTGAIATPPRVDAPPRAAATTPASAPQPVQQAVAQPQAPMQIAPQAAPVEIKSMPVTGVDNSAQPGPQAGAEAAAEPQHRGLFSVFSSEHLRNDKPLPADQAPRPPGEIGQ
jgi:hypothetical protein